MGEWKLMNLHNVSPCQQIRKITESIDELVQVFPNITQNYKTISGSVRVLYYQPKTSMSIPSTFTIHHRIPSETTTYKSIDTVENQDEVVDYPTEFLNSLDLRHTTARSYIENWRTHHTSFET
ncbi:ATP-dependent DNA helicase [Trichonephila clavipes]|nr:ATP-dependent DNA helicase [Trichonephila clavipes]